MKKKCIILLQLCLAVAFSSCETSREIIDDPTPMMFITVIKMAAPEYLNYVVVEKDYREPELCKIRSSGAACQELYLGSSPYIPLPDDYYLIDWKWGTFIYEPSNFLINVKWTDITSRYQKWEYGSNIISDHFLKAWGGASFKNIDKFLGIAPPPIDSLVSSYIPADYVRPWWFYQYNSLNDIPDSEKEEYMLKVKHMDSLQNVYKERISRIIEEGKLEKLGALYKY